MVDTCLVTGTIVAPDGTPLRRTFVLFQRTPKLPFIADDASAFPAPVTVRTDADGSVEVRLIPGTYLVKPWYSTYDPFRIVVPDEPAARLEDIQFSDPPPPLTDAELAVLQARAARDEAREAADQAEAAKDVAVDTVASAVKKDQNLADLTDPAQARNNLDVPARADVLLREDNLSDVSDPEEVRNNLGVPARSANLSDLTNLKEARSNLGEFATVADVQSRHIPPVLDSIRTNGYYDPGDGGGALYKRVSAEPAHGGKIQSADGTWWELGEADVNVLQFGAKGDGVTDDTEAFQAQLDFMGCIKAPAGRFHIAGHLQMPVGIMDCIIEGAGRNDTHILWTGDDQPDPPPNFFEFSDVFSAGHWYDTITVRNLSIRGTHDVNRSDYSAYPLLIQRARNVVVTGVEVMYSRTMGIAVREATSAVVKYCYVHHCARDGINTANCTNTVITNNVVEYTDDDCIASHNTIHRAMRQVLIANNRCKLVQGIKVLGAQAATITGNSIDYFWGQGISIATTAGATNEGINAANAVSITGNVLTNAFSRELLDSDIGETPYIRITGHSANSGNINAIPDTHSVPPYDYFYNISSSSDDIGTTPVPASGRIVVANNVFAKDMPISGNFSDLGLGLPWLRGGEYDFSLDESDGIVARRGFFLNVHVGVVNDLIVKGNVAMGVNMARFFDVEVRNLIFEGNILKDVNHRCITLTSTSSVQGVVRGNVFDMDPYRMAPSRSSDGSFNAQANPTVLVMSTSASHIYFSDNDIKNAGSIVDIDPHTLQSQGKIVFNNIRLYGEFSAGGFSYSNKGVGTLPFRSYNGEFIFISENMDLSDPSFGQVMHVSVTEAEAPVTDVYYPSGWYIHNTNKTIQGSSPNRYYIRGWVKDSPGAGSDWIEDRMYFEL